MNAAALLPEAKDGHLIVLGQTGLGKTALVRAMVSTASPQGWPRVLIADPHQEYGSCAVVVNNLDELAGYLDAAGNGPWRIAYQGDDLDGSFAVLCEAAYEIGDVLLVAEEADFWCSPASILPEFAHAIKYGRHRRVIVCGVARRPSEVHRLLTSQARVVVSFGTVEPVDLDYLRRAVSAEFTAALPDLPPLQAAWWDRRERVVHRLSVDPVAQRVAVPAPGESPPPQIPGPGQKPRPGASGEQESAPE